MQFTAQERRGGSRADTVQLEEDHMSACADSGTRVLQFGFEAITDRGSILFGFEVIKEQGAWPPDDNSTITQ